MKYRNLFARRLTAMGLGRKFGGITSDVRGIAIEVKTPSGLPAISPTRGEKTRGTLTASIKALGERLS
jgi:hypothetical protein